MAKLKTMQVPAPLESAVAKLLKSYYATQNAKPIKRELRISKREFAAGEKAVKAFTKLSAVLQKYSEKLGREYERLEDLLDQPRNKGDEAWLNAQLDKLDRAIEYVENV
jgi:hypothetical protein